jgi:hypothetical protein
VATGTQLEMLRKNALIAIKQDVHRSGDTATE